MTKVHVTIVDRIEREIVVEVPNGEIIEEYVEDYVHGRREDIDEYHWSELDITLDETEVLCSPREHYYEH